ncbi:bifunctional glutamate N-acetyltransferase/amino-acid acetyltransferase ArgJ [Nitriliruptoria bacterium AS10]|nr:bifunctional glutamate N-acetyltransferase/amino-acid acetyltransferase ArgJ [Salsipaludibacter albus]
MTAVGGLAAGAATSGVKESGAPDLALVLASGPATVAAVTTSNRVKASSAVRTDEIARRGTARAVVVNSGNANVATRDGHAHTDRLAAAVAAEAGIDPDEVVVMSTGVIGVPLPIEQVEAAVPAVVADLSDDGGLRAATAMMTTDSGPKQVAFEVTDDSGGRCVVAGMAKGVGMIEPNMATLLVTVATDAPLPAAVARQLVRRAADATFNRISVDGDQSTSDQLVLLATGTAPDPPGLQALARGVHAVCADLAALVVADGEGASRIAAITVTGATDEDQAESLARSVATSNLVRAAIHGADPNWGRILMAMGNADADFDPARVQVTCNGIAVCRFGVAASFDRGQAARAMDRDAVTIEIDLQLGRASATLLTCDLTEDYVHFNSAYTT